MTFVELHQLVISTENHSRGLRMQRDRAASEVELMIHMYGVDSPEAKTASSAYEELISDLYDAVHRSIDARSRFAEALYLDKEPA